MLPVMSAQEGDSVRSINDEYFPDIDKARVPIKYLASMFGGGMKAIFVMY